VPARSHRPKRSHHPLGRGRQGPDKLIAEKRDASGKVIRTRPLFPYPQVAKYKGSGSTDEEKNFRSKDSTGK